MRLLPPARPAISPVPRGLHVWPDVLVAYVPGGSASLRIGRANPVADSTYAAGATAYSTQLVNLLSDLGPVPRTGNEVLNTPKLDWQVNDKNHLSVLYHRLRWDSPGGVQTQATNTYAIDTFGTDFVKLDYGLTKLDSQITTKLSNEVRYQYGRELNDEGQQPYSAYTKQYLQGTNGITNTAAGDFSPNVPEVALDTSIGFLSRIALLLLPQGAARRAQVAGGRYRRVAKGQPQHQVRRGHDSQLRHHEQHLRGQRRLHLQLHRQLLRRPVERGKRDRCVQQRQHGHGSRQLPPQITPEKLLAEPLCRASDLQPGILRPWTTASSARITGS